MIVVRIHSTAKAAAAHLKERGVFGVSVLGGLGGGEAENKDIAHGVRPPALTSFINSVPSIYFIAHSCKSLIALQPGCPFGSVVVTRTGDTGSRGIQSSTESSYSAATSPA